MLHNNGNDIVNVNGFLTTNSNDIDNGNGKYDKAKKVEYIADRLIEKFKLDKKSRPFMCKVAYKLSEARIWDHYEHATSSKDGKPITNPVGLFIWLCKRDGV